MSKIGRATAGVGGILIWLILTPSATPSNSWTSRLEPDSAVTGQYVAGDTASLSSVYPDIWILPSLTVQQTEMTIAINPLNSSILLVGANTVSGTDPIFVRNQGSYYSTEGGTSWSGDNDSPLTTFTASDPIVAFDADGIAYFNFIEDFDDLGFWSDYLFKSTDSGTTWVIVDTIPNTCAPDKPHMAIDLTSSQYRNNIYVAYRELYGPCPIDQINFSRIPSGGTQFTNPIPISGSTPQPRGVNLAIGPEGQVYAVWSTRAGGEESATGIGFNVSTNGGQSFGSAFEIAGLGVQGLGDWLKPTAVRVNSFPSMAVDTTECSPYYGAIYVAWADRRNGNPDIYFVRITENGIKQGSPVLVNDDGTNTDQWMPWITVDPNGVAHVVFYDSRNDPENNCLTAVYMASSYDGGKSFAENVLISDVAFSPSPIDGADAHYMGDYIGITSDDCHAYPCWNDNREGVQQAYMAIVPTCDNLLTERTVWGESMMLDHDVVVCEGETLFVDNSSTISIAANQDRCPSSHDVDNPDKISIIVMGTLWANGASFISDSPTPTLSDWVGIDVRAGGTVKLENCTIANAVNGVYASEPALVTIDHCNFNQNTRGIFIGSASSSPTTIKYCDFDQNATGIDISSSTLINAKWNVVTNGTDGILLSNSSAVIERNVIDGMGGAGIKFYGGGGFVTIIHNDILNCDVGIYEYVNSSPSVKNNIVTGNTTGIQDIEAAELKYNDVWGNQTNYSNSSPGTGDISRDPNFVDAGNGDYHLQQSSLCIDAGDPASPYDPDLTRADIGVYYYPQGGGCPYVFTWNGNGYVMDNTILTGSEWSDGPVTDYYRLRQPLVAEDGEYRLQIREFEQEVSYIDAMELIAVDHPPNSRVGVSPNGVVFLYENEIPAVSCTDHTGRDILHLIHQADGVVYSAIGPGSMSAVFADTKNGCSQFVIANPAPAGDTMFINGALPPPSKKGNPGAGIRVDVEDPEGNWLWGDELPARGNPDDALWLLNPTKGFSRHDSVRVRLRWLLGFEMDELIYYETSSADRTITQLPLSTATHSTVGTVQSELEAMEDFQQVVLFPGESIDITFSEDRCPVLRKGWLRDFVLKSSGYYETLASVVPQYSRLSQNRPNPFNSETTIRYDLSEYGRVSVIVYNVLGQAVITLVDEEKDAGMHTVTWSGRDESGEEVSSGMYLYRIRTEAFWETRKMILLK